MNVELKSHYHVATEPDLWKSVQWASETNAQVRVVQTCVGPYGAIDQRDGTTYFDVGDHLVHVLGRLLVVSPVHMAQIVSENQEANR